jgi:release factor glutamine methyltransferase
MKGAPPTLISDEEARRLGPEAAALITDAYHRLDSALSPLPDKPEETTVAASRALWLLACGRRHSADAAASKPLVPLDADQQQRFIELVQQRLAGMPLAHLTERQQFMGMEMVAGPGALIPRKETELVARSAIDLAVRIADEQGEVLVLDVCTGSGNVAAAVAAAEPRAKVYASDVSEDAVCLARRNFEHLGLGSRVNLRCGDLFDALDGEGDVGRMHLITCNPPYISTGRVAQLPAEIAGHEPREAFDGGPLGVRILERLIREAPERLRPGGWLVFEVGLGQGPSVARRLARSQWYTSVDCLTDERDQVRGLVAHTPLG